MSLVTTSTPPDQPAITMQRCYAASPAAVFRVYMDAAALKHWIGPNGFTITVLAMDVRPGGLFRFTMHWPDGTDFPNRMTYREIEPAERLDFRHGSDIDDDPHGFDVVITFAAAPADRSILTMHSTFPSIAARDAVLQFGAVELGMQSLERFGGLRGTQRGLRRNFVPHPHPLSLTRATFP